MEQKHIRSEQEWMVLIQEYRASGLSDKKSIDGLMSIIRDTYQMDPFANAVYLFCGRKAGRLKALYYDRTGFVLLYKRLDSGRFQRPRSASEVKPLTRQEFRWLNMKLLDITSAEGIKEPVILADDGKTFGAGLENFVQLAAANWKQAFISNIDYFTPKRE